MDNCKIWKKTLIENTLGDVEVDCSTNFLYWTHEPFLFLSKLLHQRVPLFTLEELMQNKVNRRVIKQEGSKSSRLRKLECFQRWGRQLESFWFFVRLKTLEQFKHEQKGNKSEVDRWVDEVQTKKTTTKKQRTSWCNDQRQRRQKVSINSLCEAG